MKYAIIDQKKQRQVAQFDSYAAAEAVLITLEMIGDRVKGRYPRFVIGVVSVK